MFELFEDIRYHYHILQAAFSSYCEKNLGNLKQHQHFFY